MWVPRSRRASISALGLFQPMTPLGLIGWMGARLAAGFGVFGLGRSDQPEELQRVTDRLSPHLSDVEALAYRKLNHPQRYAAMALGRDGVRWVAKVSLDPDGFSALETEAKNIVSFGPYLSGALRPPTILHASEGIVILTAMSWRLRSRPWRLTPAVGHSLGSFWAGAGEGRGRTHGDFAPWNVLPTRDGWVVIDWEEASGEGLRYEDLYWYLTQASALLGHPTVSELVDGVTARSGWIGEVLTAYEAGAGIDAAGAADHLLDFCRRSVDRFDPRKPDEAKAISARRRVESALSSAGGV